MTGRIDTMVSGSRDETPGEAQVARENSSVELSIAMRGNQIDSRALFASSREISIVHGDEVYRLRLTSQNKLILTK